MAQVVYKYPVQLSSSHFILDLPLGAKVLTVQTQGDAASQHAQLWALVEKSKPTERRKFQVYGTGHDIPDGQELEYIGTYQQFIGDLVWHVFEVLN